MTKSKRDLRTEIETARRYFNLSGKRVRKLAPSHVNKTGKRATSARTRENLIDRSIRDYQPDNLIDLIFKTDQN